jgi:hypothetical protein
VRRALPASALSAAGLTWLLRAQGIIDAAPAVNGATLTSTAFKSSLQNARLQAGFRG